MAMIIDRCSECGHYGAVVELAPGDYVCEDCLALLRKAGEYEEQDYERCGDEGEADF